MSDTSTHILRRKIVAAHTRRATASLQNALVQRLEKACAKVFLDFLSIEASARAREQVFAPQPRTIADMKSDLFGYTTYGDDLGLTGCDARFIDTLIILLTGGTPTADLSRPASKTDAALTKVAINKILHEVFEPYAEIGCGPVAMTGVETEKAPLTYLLPEKSFATLRMDIIGDDGATLGCLEFVIPLQAIEKIAASETHGDAEGSAQVWAARFAKTATNVPFELTTIVERRQLPLREILALKTGDRLELSDGALSNLTLEGQTNTVGLPLFRGQLGSRKAGKAFKITQIFDV